MYCKNCGKRIITGKVKCDNCGDSVENAEYCGGFWGLIGEEKNEIVEPSVLSKARTTDEKAKGTDVKAQKENQAKKQAEESSVSTGKRSAKKQRHFYPIPYILCVVFALAFVFQSVKVSKVSKQLAKEKESVSYYTGKYFEVEEQNKEIENQISLILSDVEAIKSAVGIEDDVNDVVAAEINEATTEQTTQPEGATSEQTTQPEGTTTEQTTQPEGTTTGQTTNGQNVQ